MPQFFNVFMGDMSVVGPRPHMLKHTKDYADIIDGYMVRQLVFPGITGSAQVNGFRGETKSVEDMENRVKYDVWYLENWTLLLDIKLIFLTIINLIKEVIMQYRLLCFCIFESFLKCICHENIIFNSILFI